MIGAAAAVEKSWLGAGVSFNNPAAWSPPGAPGVGDVARLGNLPAAENSQISIDVATAVSGLELTDGMTVYTVNAPIAVLGDTVAQGQNIVSPDFGTFYSAVAVNDSPAAIDFTTLNFQAFNEGRLELLDNSVSLVQGLLHLSDETATLRGNGAINFSGAGTTLINEGLIFAGGLDGMYLNQTGGGVFDLDGASGDGRLLVASSAGALLHVSGAALTDAFSGNIAIGAGDRLHMNLSAGWTADASSTMGSAGDNGVSSASRLTGSAFVLGGTMTIGSQQGHLRIEADTTITQTAQLFVQETGLLEFTGPTRVEGGTVSTHSNSSSDGSVSFVGDTDWDGAMLVNGIARQVGTATVVGPTTITAGVLDMDGNGGTVWNIQHNAVIQSESIDSTISNTFDGALNVGGGFLSNLSIQLTGAFSEWTMAGELNLTGVGAAAFPTNRLGGSPVRVTGEVNVDNLVRVTADTTFANSSATSFNDAAAVVQLTGQTRVDQNASFAGDGALENGSTGDLLLANGASLGGVGLSNRGLLEIGDSAGTAAADRFVNHDSGVWLVEIGGLLPATDFDRLLMGGTATLDGLIEVDLIDLGAGLFLPQIGDSFTVLTAFGGVAGAFQNNSPVTNAAGQLFHWSVLYTPQDVVLELVDITTAVPEPASAVLAALSLLGAAGSGTRIQRARA